MRVREQAPSLTTPIVVSISCISYNQEKYIKKCIEGFLNQIVDFSVEILIHDDASTDATGEIIREYAEKYPHIIKPVLQTKNQFRSGVRCIHAVFNFSRSKGEFIATCEGDDYWIDNHKLSRQIHFLQSNREYTMSSHDTYVGYWNERKNFKTALSIIGRNISIDGFRGGLKLLERAMKWNGDFWISRRIQNENRSSTLEFNHVLEMYKKTIFIPTVSIVGNGELLRKMPSRIFDSPTGHKEHIFWLAIHGKIFYVDKVLGQKINQMNSLTQTRIHKSIHKKSDRPMVLKNYLSRFLELDIPVQSKNLIGSFVESNG